MSDFAADTAATPAPIPGDAGTPAPTTEPVISEDAMMEQVWAKSHPQERVDRADDGKFTGREGANTEPPDGQAEGEGQGVQSAPAETPLPANWDGMDEVWGKIPADARTKIAEHQQRQHAKLSDLGRKVAAYEPMAQVASEFAEYFNGNLTLPGPDGKPVRIAPHDGVRYLAGIQRAMDKQPVETLLSIMDTYKVRDKIAAHLSGQAPAQPQGDAALLSRIDQLENIIRKSSDPSLIEQVVDRKNARAAHEQEVSRLMDPKGSRPLAPDIEAETLAFFIGKAWKALGDDAGIEAVFDHAYKAAVEADPALRAKAEAARKAAEDTAAKAESAKRGASVNLRSTAAGKPRQLSDDELMEEVWRKNGLN